ncbi:hypothetical protein ACQUW5_08610 [Legionella sp. CNM-1927-20]|uniref:hypothetical protein n=1 Tax=Legionella sp. CNM-1927-20 TaxID=3422221 RepID=UPI00403AE1D1
MQNNNPHRQDIWQTRIDNYHLVNQELNKLSEQVLIDQFFGTTPQAPSLGSTNTLLQLNNKTIFIKAI